MNNAEAKDLEQHLLDQIANRARFEFFFWHRLRSEFILKQIQRLIGHDHPVVLDIGAGAGIFGRHFRKQFPRGRYVFVEPLPLLANRLRAEFSETSDWIHQETYESADVVLLLDVIEHQKNDLTFLRGIIEKCKSQTLFIVTCPAFHFLWSDWDVKAGHFRRYVVSNLQSLARTAGLQIIQSRYLFPCMFFGGMIRKLLPVQSSEFPKLFPLMNRFLYGLGKVEMAMGSWIPFGSSVTLVAKKPESI